MSVVSIRDLKVSFDGVRVLHGINLEIARGEALGLVGESGCGTRFSGSAVRSAKACRCTGA
jgi:ABC-type dipeptide/oligopeptide/nickel transport system ATPase component